MEKPVMVKGDGGGDVFVVEGGFDGCGAAGEEGGVEVEGVEAGDGGDFGGFLWAMLYMLWG
jgi:hypothetical protein